MRHPFRTALITAAFTLGLAGASQVQAATVDLGNGFSDHGVANPLSNNRGTVSTVDGNGHDVTLTWLFDHRGGYALLVVDTVTGESKSYPVPFPPGGDTPYASILSSGNKLYTHYNSYFCEFDPVKREFTFHEKTAPQMAMGMTEDDNGVIWSVTYPQSGVVSFNPKTREFTDFGQVYKQNWQQYQRDVATDDAGWLYFGIGSTKSQIIAFNPADKKALPVVAEEERLPTSTAIVQRDMNGKVYGRNGEQWYELYKGEVKKIDKPTIKAKPYITGNQGLFHGEFPSGKRLKTLDTVGKKIAIEDPASGQVKEFDIEYESEGAHLMGVIAASDGTICGGTFFPFRFFSYNPKSDEWIRRPSFGQWNTVAALGDRYFAGTYPGGNLLEWDPASDWVDTRQDNEASNPRFLFHSSPVIHRPHDLLPTPDGKWVIMAGTPEYGATGGGLLFWDRENAKPYLIDHTELLPLQSPHSLAALPDGKIVGGTTTAAGTGGEVKAKEGELFLLDLATRKIEWHEPIIPGTRSYHDLAVGKNGLVYGVAGRTKFFVFDPATRKLVHQADLEPQFGATNSQQGPRVFAAAPDGTLYMLFEKGVARVDQETHAIEMLAESPIPIGAGGTIHDGRIYFGTDSHLLSYKLPQ